MRLLWLLLHERRVDFGWLLLLLLLCAAVCMMRMTVMMIVVVVVVSVLCGLLEKAFLAGVKCCAVVLKMLVVVV